MEDCKHDSFKEVCCVCWFKVAYKMWDKLNIHTVPSVIKNASKDDLLDMSYRVARVGLTVHLNREKELENE